MKLKIFKYKKVKSTNDIAIRKIRSGIKNGIVTSDVQSSGRGRHGNKWVSYKGNLFVTIFFSIWSITSFLEKLFIKFLSFSNTSSSNLSLNFSCSTL